MVAVPWPRETETVALNKPHLCATARPAGAPGLTPPWDPQAPSLLGPLPS